MIVNVILELDKIFNELNKAFFKDELKKPVILIQSKAKKNTLGTCSVNPIWENKKNEEDRNYEITLSGEYLNRPIEEIIATLLHEMVHLYCSVNDIKDTSNNFVYHNKNFKKEAELRGLIITKAEFNKSIGWSVSELNEPTKELIKKFNINLPAFDYYRKSYVKPETLKQIRYKYACPKCDLKISHHKEVYLKCGSCDVDLELNED
ncbi:MAG: hypothetical protein DRN27_06250 [Thermoplasmata archaeon]|nr:MAG: hypothetical protein DRN27_06250 [Thermoplasmata archaeon]